jgi:GntR family transcriptional regulator
VEITWNNKQPIYLQLRDRLVALIMDGELAEGDALPSVRQISSEQRINPVTVSKAIQMLVDEELVKKKTGAWNVCCQWSERQTCDRGKEQIPARRMATNCRTNRKAGAGTG